ncbi:hypothetical protein JCM21142_353 [Saccharicrinis fermentans DSM 9555 = JCM 21142]|uniref:Protein-glutamine gamma-glutamyltransferase-like C-terminal domain-containing protein n=2 Tax=Saccharicrinis fermentans TaxID=982 RepID=W7Y2H7_9BACT|nr:hypothetical protein JCM21142_353 [Saccharicrinis fermentans DSM 9555 = JCM 21142]
MNLLLFIGAGLYGQDSTVVEPWDRSKVDYRPASVEAMEAYKLMPKYVYDRYVEPESIWDKIKDWLWTHILRSRINGKVVMYVFIGIAALILLFIILKLLGIKPSGLFIFAGNTKVTNLRFQQVDDDIYNENLEDILQVAIKNKAYREAVRVMYLLSLRHLDSAGVIQWEPWKTNRDYYYELKSDSSKVMFKQLVRSYEYIWYGQFGIGEEKFKMVHANFDEFEQLIHQGKMSV